MNRPTDRPTDRRLHWNFRRHSIHTEIEKSKLDYIISLWWKDLHHSKSGLSMGFTIGLIYGLSIQPLYNMERPLREELLFLYELANEITKENLQ